MRRTAPTLPLRRRSASSAIGGALWRVTRLPAAVLSAAVLSAAVLSVAVACGSGEDPTRAGGMDSGVASSADAGAPEIDAGLVYILDAGPAPPNPLCQEACRETRDCAIDGQLTDDVACVQGRCRVPFRPPPPQCAVDQDCVGLFRGWSKVDLDGDQFGETPCTSDAAQCDLGVVCCPLGGQVCVQGGFCAFVEPGTGCFHPQQAMDVQRLRGGKVRVCAVPNAEDAICAGRLCRDPCNVEADCLDRALPHCNVATGACECVVTTADSCQENFEGPGRCMSDRTCGCASDADCIGTGFDRCVDGVCGCSSANACTESRLYDRTRWVCEALR